MNTSAISLISNAQKLTSDTCRYRSSSGNPVFSLVETEVVSQVVSRIAALLLSPAAAVDLAFHSIMIFPAFIYALGTSIYQREMDFLLPWQHLKRIQNAVAPLIFGSIFGVFHPNSGILISEPSDKHAIVGMLSSNIDTGYRFRVFDDGDGNQIEDPITQAELDKLKRKNKKVSYLPLPPLVLDMRVSGKFETICTPIQSLSIIEEIAKNHQYAESDSDKEIFSKEHIKVIQSAKNFEASLEILQTQEFNHKIGSITRVLMEGIYQSIETYFSCEFTKRALQRLSGLIIPILAVLDIGLTSISQTFLICTGLIQLISFCGPFYTEVTANPLMHLAFFIENNVRLILNLIATLIWFISPTLTFERSFLPANFFFKLEMEILMLQIKCKMYFLENNERFAIPIVYSSINSPILSLPAQSMHMTYLIIEKKDDSFNLYWTNRPTVNKKENLSKEQTMEQIRSMLDARFPSLDIPKSIHSDEKDTPVLFPNSSEYMELEGQGNISNCVVSNLFGMLETLDKIKGIDKTVTALRYQTVRKVLSKNYEFYKNDFFPNIQIGPTWTEMVKNTFASI